MRVYCLSNAILQIEFLLHSHTCITESSLSVLWTRLHVTWLIFAPHTISTNKRWVEPDKKLLKTYTKESSAHVDTVIMRMCIVLYTRFIRVCTDLEVDLLLLLKNELK